MSKNYFYLLIPAFLSITSLANAQQFVLSGPSHVCPGTTQTYTMQDQGGGIWIGSYTWKLDGTTLSNSGYSKTITFPTVPGGGYSTVECTFYSVGTGTFTKSMNVSYYSPGYVNRSRNNACVGGDSVLLTAMGTSGSGQVWQKKETGSSTWTDMHPSSAFPNPIKVGGLSATTEYRVRQSVSCGTIYSPVVSVQGGQSPDPYPSYQIQYFCEPDEVTINLETPPFGISNQWYVSQNAVAPFGYGNSSSFDLITTMSVFITRKQFSSGCESRKTEVIAQYDSPPAPPVIRDKYFCGTNQQVMFEVENPDDLVKWYSNATSSSILHTGSIYETTLSSSISYFVANEAQSGCKSNRTQVYANQENAYVPALNYSADRVANGRVHVEVTGAPTDKYRWYDSNGNLIEGLIGPAEDPFFSGSGSIKVSSIVGGCESSQLTIPVIIYPAPVISSSDGTTLMDNSVELSVGNYASYQWYKDGQEVSGASSSTLTASVPGRYSVKAFSPSGHSMLSREMVIKSKEVIPAETTIPVLSNEPGTDDLIPIRNYVRSYTARYAGMTESGLSWTNRDTTDMVITTQYVDGLGRPIQQVGYGQSATGGDLVVPTYYDAFNRQIKTYLPFTASSEALSDGFYTSGKQRQYNFYTGASAELARSGVPYSEFAFEASPLNRVLSTSAPGENYQMSTRRTVNTNTAAYNISIHGPLIIWEVNDQGELVANGAYSDWSMLVNTTQDENGYYIDEVIDLEGKTLFKIVYLEDFTPLITAYVYDTFGNLQFVIPPEGSKAIDILPATFLWSQDQGIIDRWCFQYRYDQRHRMTEKRVPGTDSWTKMVYDKRDRLVLTQDANMALADQWLYTKYDDQNRPISTGYYTESSLSTIEAALSSQTVFGENRTTSGIGYTSVSFPTTVDEYLTLTYYNDYTFTSLLNAGMDYNYLLPAQHCVSVPQATYCMPATDEVLAYPRELITGSRTKVLGQEEWIDNVIYYDDYYRPVQTLSNNGFQDVQDRMSTTYDFQGMILKTIARHEKMGENTMEIRRRYVYDHTGRLLRGYHELLQGDQTPGSNEVLLAENKYNELGELIEKNLHVENEVPAQSVDYRYNIRGWLQSINNATMISTPANPDGGNQLPDYFGMELWYEGAYIQPQE